MSTVLPTYNIMYLTYYLLKPQTHQDHVHQSSQLKMQRLRLIYTLLQEHETNMRDSSCHKHSTYTDSQNCVDTFKRITTTLITERKLLNLNNHHISSKLLVQLKALNVTLYKVKGHSDSLNNDRADEKVNLGRNQPAIIVNHKIIPNALLTCTLGYVGPISIDRNIRKFAKQTTNISTHISNLMNPKTSTKLNNNHESTSLPTYIGKLPKK